MYAGRSQIDAATRYKDIKDEITKMRERAYNTSYNTETDLGDSKLWQTAARLEGWHDLLVSIAKEQGNAKFKELLNAYLSKELAAFNHANKSALQLTVGWGMYGCEGQVTT